MTSSSAFLDQLKARKWLVLLGLLLVAGLAYWHFAGGTPTARRGGGAAPVRTARVERRDMSVVEHTLGTVIANAMVSVTARVQGTLEGVHFTEGQYVKKGDLLFQIDPRPFQAAAAQAKAVLARDQALLRNAQRDKARYEQLQTQGASSQQQRDTSATNADVLAATVAADQASLDMAQLNLGYTQIHAPVDGKTGAVLVQPGNMVAANGTTVLATIAQIQPVKVSFNLPQADLPRIQARQRIKPLLATLDVNDAGGTALSAPVGFTGNAVNNQSGTVELRAEFSNADHVLLPGQLVNVTVEIDTLRNVLVVPRSAINDGPNGPYVYVVEDGRAQEHAVKVLFDDATNIAFESDFKEGEDVITEGQLRVNPGGPVRVMAAAGAPAAAEAGRGRRGRGGRRGGRRGGEGGGGGSAE